MIVIGFIIGSGIFLTPSLVARALPSPIWILSVWILGGLVALSGALTFAELSSMRHAQVVCTCFSPCRTDRLLDFSTAGRSSLSLTLEQSQL